MHQPLFPGITKQDGQSASPMTEREAAQRTGMSLAFLRHERRQGRGPAYLRLGRAVRYRPIAIDAWLDERTVPAEPARTVRPSNRDDPRPHHQDRHPSP